MKQSPLIILFFLIACSGSVSESTETEHAVETLVRKKFQWMIRPQLDSLDQILDSRLKFIHSNGWVQSKEDVINDLKSKKLVLQKIDVSELSVRQYGSLAVAVGKGSFSGTNSGNAFATELIFTEVYSYRDNKWLLVSRQATKLQ